MLQEKKMKRFGMEPIWTSHDTRNVVLASLVPGTTALTAFAVFAKDRQVVDWWSHAKKPDWAPTNPAIYSVFDILTLSPLGYASYLVYKNGGGLHYNDTKFALGIYGLNMIFALTTIPLIKKRSFLYLFRNTVLLNATAIGAAYAFYGIDKTAGKLLIPYAIWTGFYAFLTYAMNKENASHH
ncbi:unnamed protein product [Thelazia callipaeda]|uniref:TspO/MBR family protein n=1 Tax=Thelazia callipaeda TaxID=103827 RepID=A0A0N5CPD9_THECL|nr:unnamed protein product [Thelazia callipaeda]